MTNLIILIILIGAYLYYRSWKAKKAERLKRDVLSNMVSEYERAFRSGDINRIKTTARNLINSPIIDQNTLNLVYENTLSLLKNNPALKPFALEIGRKKYAAFRESGTPTVYDESAIMNDINAAL